MEIEVYVKIKDVAKRHKQLKESDKNLLKKEFERLKKRLLTRFKSSDTLSKSLECDKQKQKVTT